MYIVAHIDVKMLNAGPEKALELAKNLGPTQNFAMYSLVTLVPAVSLLLTAVPLFFYNYIGDKKKNVIAELAEMRRARGIKVEED